MTIEQRDVIDRALALLQSQAQRGRMLARHASMVTLREEVEKIRTTAEEVLKACDNQIGAAAVIDRADRSRYPRAKTLSSSRRGA